MDKMWKNGRLRILILTFSFEKQQRLCFNETRPRTVLYVSGCGLDLNVERAYKYTRLRALEIAQSRPRGGV